MKKIRVGVSALWRRNALYRMPYSFEGSVNMVGTTASVSVKLTGEDGTSSGVRHLHRPGSFQRGSRDCFVVATDRSLGRLARLTVWLVLSLNVLSFKQQLAFILLAN